MAYKPVQQNSTESTPRSLGPKQIQVIAALVLSSSVTEATKLSGIDRTTIYSWMNNDSCFLSELNRRRMERRDAPRSQLRQLASEALTVIADLLKGEQTPPAIRLKAALSISQVAGALETESIGHLDPESIEADIKARLLMNAVL